jgi:hypothetical protein
MFKRGNLDLSDRVWKYKDFIICFVRGTDVQYSSQAQSVILLLYQFGKSRIRNVS